MELGSGKHSSNKSVLLLTVRSANLIENDVVTEACIDSREGNCFNLVLDLTKE